VPFGRRGLHGRDGHKQVTGRERHLLVDTNGFVLKVVVHAANIHNSQGGRLVMDIVRDEYVDLRKLWVDQGYRGVYWTWLPLDRGLAVEVMRDPVVGAPC
jgi:putative transposase